VPHLRFSKRCCSVILSGRFERSCFIFTVMQYSDKYVLLGLESEVILVFQKGGNCNPEECNLPENWRIQTDVGIGNKKNLYTKKLCASCERELNASPRNYVLICVKKYFQTQSTLDDWLTVYRSVTLVHLQLDAQNSYLFTYNTFINLLAPEFYI